MPDLQCPNCGASASLPLGMTCDNHQPVPVAPADAKPQRFRKKPVEVEAMQFTRESGPEVWEWADSKPMRNGLGEVFALRTYTSKGDMLAGFGDWIVKDVNGEFCPVAPDIFAETYEVAS